MKLGPRTQLVLIAAMFAAPIVASTLAYLYGHRAPTANHGELLLPPAQLSSQAFADGAGRPFPLAGLRGRWILAMTDAGACPDPCASKLFVMRQVRLAQGREAIRVARLWVVDDGQAPAPSTLAPFAGTEVAIAARGSALAPDAGDRGHIYLVDPHGNVMMRWGARDDPDGLIKDLQRLLKASQIG